MPLHTCVCVDKLSLFAVLVGVVASVRSAWQRRSSVHERRDSLSLREMREECERLQESMMLSVNAEEEDEDDKMPQSPITVVR